MDKNKVLYTKGEEIFNGVSHIVGAGLGIVFLVLAVVFSAVNRLDGISITACIIYGVSVIVLYTMSAIYHMLRPNKAKRVFRILDHCTIYFLIAGSYTAIIALGMRNSYGLILALIVWIAAIGGITGNAIRMNNKIIKALSMVLYIIMGWSILFFVNPLLESISLMSFSFLLSGGIAYTIGSVLYGVGKKKKWIHSIFHLFVVLGTCLQFVSIMLLIFGI